jgi:carbonic anhydrase
MLKYRIHECYDDEVDFFDALRQCDAENFTGDEADEAALAELKQALHDIDAALEKLITMKPEMTTRYRQQHQQAEAEISKQIMRLGLHDVVVA